MPTTARGITTPDGPNPWNLVVDLAATATTIDTAIDNLETQIAGSDTYQPAGATWASGFASGSTASYQIRAGWVVLHVSAVGNVAVGTTDIIAALPANITPQGENVYAAAYFGSGYTGTAIARPDGTVAVAQQTGATRIAPRVTFIYPQPRP